MISHHVKSHISLTIVIAGKGFFMYFNIIGLFVDQDCRFQKK